MRQQLSISVIVVLIISTIAFAEIDSDFRVSICDNVNHTAIGINGTILPPNLMKDRFSLGFEFGMQLIERFLHDRGPSSLDTVDEYSGTGGDYVIWFNKNYRDYMFLPFGVLVRYDLTDPGKLNRLRPSVFLGIGGVMNIYQESTRQIQDWFDNYPYTAGEPLLYRWAVDSGGKSIATFDFYVKPKIAVFYSRIYASYEMYYGTEYLRHTISVGYVFRL